MDIDFVEKNISPVLDNLFCNALVPLFIYDGKYKLQGSSVYIKKDNVFYLLTASHIVEEQKGLFYIQKNADTSIIQGIKISVAIKSKTVDLGIYKLEEQLKSYIPLTLCDFDSFINFENFIAIGYPATKMKHYNQRNISVKHYSLFSNIDTEFNKANFPINRYFEIPIQFSQHKVKSFKGDTITFPIPNGMSGGMLIGYKKEFSKVNLKLVGILTRYNATKGETMVATKIDFFKTALEKFDDCISSGKELQIIEKIKV